MLDDFTFELTQYFPLDKVDWDAGTYDQYLFDLQKTIIDNYAAGNYQVAFFYSHLIFMSYVYYSVETAYDIAPKRVSDIYYSMRAYSGSGKKPDLSALKIPYELSLIPEKEVFNIFHALNMPHKEIQELSKYVSERDNFAHASGKRNISEQEYQQYLNDIYRNMNILHKVFRNNLKELFVDFLLETYASDYENFIEDTENLIFNNSFSFVDVSFICSLGISQFRNKNDDFKNNYRFIKLRQIAFVDFCTENYGIQTKADFEAQKNMQYHLFKYKENAHGYIENELGISSYVCEKDGGGFPLHECPECEEEQLTIDGNGDFICFACEEEFKQENMGECCRCGRIMPMGEEDISVCSDCLCYVASKDD